MDKNKSLNAADKALRYAYASNIDILSLNLKLEQSKMSEEERIKNLLDIEVRNIDFNDFFERQSKMSEKERIKNLCDAVINEILMISAKMRDATKEEQESINKYIDSISVDTGINFWDILEKAETKRKEVQK